MLPLKACVLMVVCSIDVLCPIRCSIHDSIALQFACFAAHFTFVFIINVFELLPIMLVATGHG